MDGDEFNSHKVLNVGCKETWMIGERWEVIYLLKEMMEGWHKKGILLSFKCNLRYKLSCASTVLL